MDESLFIAWQHENCMMGSRVQFELLQVQFVPKLHSHPCDYILVVMNYHII